MPDAPPISDAERQRRSLTLREQGGLIAPVTLSKDQLDMLMADGWLDTTEADAERDNARRHTRLFAQACGAAIGRILDGLSKKTSRVRSRGDEPR